MAVMTHGKKRLGFTLVELAVVLVIVGLMSTLILQAQKTNTPDNCYATTQSQMTAIRDSITSFVSRQGYYPMPASQISGTNSSSWGVSVGPTGDAAGAPCINDAGGHPLYCVGQLPFSTLGLGTAYAADCWGNQFTYYISYGLTSTDSATYSKANGILTAISGPSTTPVTLMGNAAYGVVSHGATGTGDGGVPKNATSMSFCANPGHLDHNNCNAPSGAATKTIATGPFNSGANAGTEFFDDVVIFAGKAGGNCNSAPYTNLQWTVGAATCSGDITDKFNNTDSRTITDSTGNTMGTASFKCVNGTPTADQMTATCVISCPAQSIGWTDSGGSGSTCSANFPTTAGSSTATGTSGSNTGSATCSATGTWPAQATGTCVGGAPCTSTSLSWGSQCNAIFPDTASGTNVTRSYSSGSYSGAGTATCTNGSWSAASGSCSSSGGTCNTNMPAMPANHGVVVTTINNSGCVSGTPGNITNDNMGSYNYTCTSGSATPCFYCATVPEGSPANCVANDGGTGEPVPACSSTNIYQCDSGTPTNATPTCGSYLGTWNCENNAGQSVSCTKYCFLENALITMADGSRKKVNELEIGDEVLGKTRINHVIRVPNFHSSQAVYGFNGGEKFVTAGHPFYTKKGWKAIDPALTPAEHHNVKTTRLKVGDTLWMDDGTPMKIKSIDREDSGDHELFSPAMDGDHTYYSNGLLVHNKTACPSGGPT